MLGLPGRIRACLFDLDGVLTETAKVHAAAWKAMFDVYLRRRAAAANEPFVAFDAHDDYNRYVDGKPRFDGVRSFLASRGIELPEGGPEDPPVAETVSGLGNRKNDLVLKMIREEGVEAYPGSIRYLEALRGSGVPCAVVSSSVNCRQVLEAAHLDGFCRATVDGLTARRQGLKGKPSPDTYLAAAELLGAGPESAAVFEDALAGVEAGRAGGFAFVVGVDRVGQADQLLRHGADVVVQDLSELLGPS